MKCVSYACGLEKGGDQRGKNRNKEKINQRVKEELQHTGPARLRESRKNWHVLHLQVENAPENQAILNSYFIREHLNVQHENVHDLTMTKKHK